MADNKPSKPEDASQLITNPKEPYSAFITELRYRYELLWRIRQIYATAILAITAFTKGIEPTPCQGLALLILIAVSFVAVIITDRSYQKKKYELLNNLHKIEEHLRFPDYCRLGRPDNIRCWDLWKNSILWIIVIFAPVLAILDGVEICNCVSQEGQNGAVQILSPFLTNGAKPT